MKFSALLVKNKLKLIIIQNKKQFAKFVIPHRQSISWINANIQSLVRTAKLVLCKWEMENVLYVEHMENWKKFTYDLKLK